MYKIISIGIILSLSLYTSLLAVDSIDIQIAALQEASPAERVELMNAIKIQLSKMNERDRTAAISHLRQKRGAAQMNTENNTDGSMQYQQQMGTMENMGRQEQMNQRQGLEQYRQGQGPGGGGPPQNGNPNGKQ